MLIGHEHTRELLRSYAKRLQDGVDVPFHFIILSWPAHIGKLSILREFALDMVGMTWQQDMMVLEDCTSDLGKPHALKIELADDEQTIEKKDGTKVQDLGMRELVQRLSMSPAGERKICLLENIERMSIGAANAFLKTAEEPLPQRLILATTSNESMLLETIRSRAWTIHCPLPSRHDVVVYLRQIYPTLGEDDAVRLASLVGDRVWLAVRLLEDQWEENDRLHTLLLDAKSVLDGLIDHKDPFSTFQLLQKLSVTLWIDMLLEYLIDGASERGKHDLVEACLLAKRYIQSRVQEDNVLMWLAYGVLWDEDKGTAEEGSGDGEI